MLSILLSFSQKNNFVMTEDIESNIYSDWIARKTFETYQDLKNISTITDLI